MELYAKCEQNFKRKRVLFRIENYKYIYKEIHFIEE